MDNPQHDRALARERIANLIYAMATPLETEKQQLKTLLQTKTIDKNNPDLLALQAQGFLYTAEAFNSHKTAYQQTNLPQDDVTAFIQFSLLKALTDYIAQFTAQHRDKGYITLYKKLHEAIDTDNAPLLQEIEPLLIKHQNLATDRQFSTRIAFFHHAGLTLPEHIRQKAKEKYPLWNGKYPLQEIAKDNDTHQTVIRLDNIGISLEQLNNVMNQKGENIVLPGTACDGHPNPFRTFTFEDAQGQTYQVGSSFDAQHVFKVHAFHVDAQGEREQADFPGWMSAPLKGEENKDVTAAVAHALLTLREYIGPPILDTTQLRKESLNDMVATLLRYQHYETIVDTMAQLEHKNDREMEEDDQLDTLTTYWKTHQKQHRFDKRILEAHLNAYLRFLIEEDGFDYDKVLKHIDNLDGPQLKQALEMVLQKFENRELLLAQERTEHIQGLLAHL